MRSFLESKEAGEWGQEILSSITGDNGVVDWHLLGSDEFDAAWTKVTTSQDREAWGVAQSNFLGRTHLKPITDHLSYEFKGNVYVERLLANEAFLEALYSGGIQFGAGGAKRKLVMPAILKAKKENRLDDTAYVISLIYANREAHGHPRPTEEQDVLKILSASDAQASNTL